MRRFRVTVEYDGRPFVGWQRQTNGATVQGALERAIAAATGETVATHAAGRTDAGVHARGQVAHFDLATALSPFRLMGALNAHLRPDPVAIITCEVVPGDFHARFDCLGRAYRYRIINRRAPLTVDLGFAWHVARPLDADTMHQAAQILVGEHDFTTFRSIHCQSLSPVKTLDRLNVRRDGEELIVEAAARSFLHHQVRSMVGCLKLVGDGQWTGERLKQALRAVDRTALGLNAPPDGLTFVEARYSHMSVELTKA